jgi:hypothetical protein
MTPSAQELKNYYPINICEKFGLFFFIIYFLVYVFSNASTTFEPSHSNVKHIIIVIVAFFSFIFLPLQTIKSVVIFFPVVIIYLLGCYPFYAIMALVFSASLPLLGRGVGFIIDRRRIKIVLIFMAIALSPLIIALLVMEFDAVFSNYYGRPRLLLGYWHPKEAAASISVPIFLYFLIRDRNLPWITGAIFICLIWIIGSRNLAISMFLALGLRLYPSLTFKLLGFIIVVFLIYAFSVADIIEFVDELLSFRLTNWGGALSSSINAAYTDKSHDDRFSIDSYFVEVFILSGWFGVSILISWLIIFYKIFIVPNKRDTWSRALFIAILFFAFFDSGIMSTGNIFHILTWTIIGLPIFKGR